MNLVEAFVAKMARVHVAASDVLALDLKLGVD
jgi:hypothetical protein